MAKNNIYSVGIGTFTPDCDENEGGYYAEFFIINEKTGDEIVLCDDFCVHAADLAELTGDDRYDNARAIATAYMLEHKSLYLARFLNAQIYKETSSGKVTQQELDLINARTQILGNNNDRANGIFAFALDLDRDEADDLVDELNDLTDGGDWYLGDAAEDYVYCD